MQEPHSLEPPERKDIADPGAHQLAEASDSEDQFMDAQSIPSSSTRSSLETGDKGKAQDPRQDASSSPGSELRGSEESDGGHDVAATTQHLESNATTPKPDDIMRVPLTVLEESSGEHPGQHSAEVQEQQKMDACPDIVLGSDHDVKDVNEAQTHGVPSDAEPDEQSTVQEAVEDDHLEEATQNATENDPDTNFDDDFDDFEEGDGQDEDFDDFEDGFQEPETQAAAPPPAMPPMPPPPPQNQLPFSIPDFDGLNPDEIISSIDPCISNLFPPEDCDLPIFPDLAKDPVFLTSRSASLWSQLVAPPPLAPPDWIRSHTRRLFLVSLGVPVDLDEILPASKQKKLILPSLHTSSTSPRPSIDRRQSAAAGRSGANAAAASTSSSAEDPAKGPSSAGRKRKGPPPEPELDLVAARHLCQTTDEALSGMTAQELRDHVAKLEAMQDVAKELLDYWTKRMDEKIGDKEAFEGVIENLVAHARKVRK